MAGGLLSMSEPGESLDILPRRIAWQLCAGAGEDDFLLERQAFVGPELLIHFPDPLGIDNADLAPWRQLRHTLLDSLVPIRITLERL